MKNYNDLKNLFSEISVFNSINSLLEWDMATMMPKNSRKSRINQINTINENKKRIYEFIKKNQFFEKVEIEKLSKDDQRNLQLMQKKFDYFTVIPIELINKNSQLSFECEEMWRKARENNNFIIVKDKLSSLFEVVREKSKILSDHWNKSEYDSLISLYDDSFTAKEIDALFRNVELFVKPLLKQIEKEDRSPLTITKPLSEEEQFELSKYCMKKFGFDFSRGRVDKSLHPFCGGYHDDVRITTRFEKNNLFSCFDALVHETGHAIYELGLPKKFKNQPLGNAVGMCVHESQSLFLEMQISKSREFNDFLEKILRKKFKRIGKEWSSDNLFNLRSEVRRNFIRVDADEICYPLHIIHRFNIEKKLFIDNQNIKDLPDIWNFEFKKILNLDVKSDNQGCLQDIHWFSGAFGYFPSYCLGAMIAAQLKVFLSNHLMSYNDDVRKGNFKNIVLWLKDNIHSYGSKYNANQLLKKTTGKELSSVFYKDHLSKRYN